MTLTHQTVPLDAIRTHPRNYRQGDVGAICESLAAHGQYRPLTVQRSTGYILCGNHTYLAMIHLGYTHVEVDYIDCTDEQATRILIADNRASALAANNEHRLADLLEELALTSGGLTGTLYDGDALDQLLQDLDREPLMAEQENKRGGDLEAGTVSALRIHARHEVRWIACRAYRHGARKATVAALNMAKDLMDSEWIEAIAAEIADAATRLLGVMAPDAVVTAPPARDSALKRRPHYATEIAKRVAGKLGLAHEVLFSPRKEKHKGHHARREKEPMRLNPSVKVPSRVLLIDDVASSGETIEHAANLLGENGSKVTCIVWLYSELADA